MFRQISIIYLTTFVLLALISCNSGNNDKLSTDIVNNPSTASEEFDGSGLPEIKFVSDNHDFGEVVQGEVVTFAFKFENVGQSDLLISNVSTSCGCTVSKYPKDPVPPGGKESIQVTFDSSGRKGFQSKTATVVANTQPSKTTLRVEARVKQPGR